MRRELSNPKESSYQLMERELIMEKRSIWNVMMGISEMVQQDLDAGLVNGVREAVQALESQNVLEIHVNCR